jgi:phosphoribosyl 1,2-cyclic phosphate phosphodiesterase
MNKITILGSGTSTGVPILGCNCQVCQSNDIRNKRLRTSALLELSQGRKLLIDATPDLRAQLLAKNITEVHGVIITHDHADHTHGMDDLRPFAYKLGTALPVFTDKQTADDLTRKFSYIFDRENYFSSKEILGGGIPLLDLHQISEGSHQILGEDLEFFGLPHGHGQSLAVRHRKMAYITDCRQIPGPVIQKLRDTKLEILLIDCLRPNPHQTHLHLELTLEYVSAISPQLAVLIHMGHEWDYLELIRELRKRGVKNTLPAVDGAEFLYS